jgi:SNF2 family DNA or RNA helicase
VSYVLHKRRANARNWQSRSIVDSEIINRYIYAERMNHDYVKNYDKFKLYKRLPDFKFHTRPRLHQLQVFFLTTYYRNLLLFLFMGAGKTKIMLDTIRFRRKHHALKKTLVLTLNITSAKTWQDESAKHAPDLKCVILSGSSQQRIKAAHGDADIYVTNVHALLGFGCIRKPVIKDGRTLKTKKWHVSAKKMKVIARLFDTIIIDEIHIINRPSSILWMAASHLCSKMKFRYGLTGTPFGKDPRALYGEFKLIDDGETFGQKIEMFYKAFYIWKKKDFGADWVFNVDTRPTLRRIMKNRSISYKKEECLDLPKLNKQIIHIEQSDEMLMTYQQIVKLLRSAHSMVSLENQFVNLRQCTSGYQTLKYAGPEIDGVMTKGTREIVNFKDNPKMEALQGLIESLPEWEKIIIFVEYVHSLHLVSALLTKMKVAHQTLYGGTKDKIGALDKFYIDPKCRVLLGNNVSISTSINPQEVCHYGIFFETSVRPIIREQAEARLHRQGQKLPVFLYDLVVMDSVDDRIYEFLRQGRDLMDALMKPGGQSLLFAKGVEDATGA